LLGQQVWYLLARESLGVVCCRCCDRNGAVGAIERVLFKPLPICGCDSRSTATVLDGNVTAAAVWSTVDGGVDALRCCSLVDGGVDAQLRSVEDWF
jgi:hypothetical protein